MMWQDILVEVDVDAETLTKAIAAVFRVDCADVEVVEDMEKASGKLVVCDKSYKKGPFSLLISIYLKRGEPPAEASGAIELSNCLGKRLLIDGGTIDPYVMRLIEHGYARTVSVDVDALDERDEYVIDEYIVDEDT